MGRMTFKVLEREDFATEGTEIGRRASGKAEGRAMAERILI